MAGVVIPQDRGASLSDHEAVFSSSHKGSSDETAADASADQLLASLGYAQEMVRNRSTLQVAFMSFVLAAIPYGLSTTMYYPLAGGGPANIIWGWIAVSCIIMCVAASLGEITSVYPTAGGVYYQTFQLAPPSWRRVASWICGWLYVVGNVTITLAVNFGTALFIVACIDVFESSPGVSVFPGETYQIFLIFLGLTLLCNAISAYGDRWLPILDVRLGPVSAFGCSRDKKDASTKYQPCRTLPPLPDSPSLEQTTKSKETLFSEANDLSLDV